MAGTEAPGSASNRGTLDSNVILSRPMIDGFGRRISYVRMSVTDRCDLRCRYCMAEEMVELAELLIARGVKRIRLTGGEPLVRKGIDLLARELGRRIGNGLDELT